MLLLTFMAGANRYAIDVARVVEVVPRVELRQISHAPAYLAGLLGYRGTVVPVIDLGLLLDVGMCRDCLSTRIILVNDAPDADDHTGVNRDQTGGETAGKRVRKEQVGSLLGLVAEHVSDLKETRPEDVSPFPICLPRTPYLGSLVQTDQGIVQLIVVDRIREGSLRASDLGKDEVAEPLSRT